MPYIKQGQRDRIERDLVTNACEDGIGLAGFGESLWDEGELNYVITTICLDYMGLPDCAEPSYAKINEVIGVLECAKLEMYRRLAGPYEDFKASENGDLYAAEEE